MEGMDIIFQRTIKTTGSLKVFRQIS
jgi:hypothetical protein